MDHLIRMFQPQYISIVVPGGEPHGAWKLIGGLLRCNYTVVVDAWR